MVKRWLEYKLDGRKWRYWFQLPADSDHWRCQYRIQEMVEVPAILAQQNGYAGGRVLNPSGILAAEVKVEIRKTGKAVVSIQMYRTADDVKFPDEKNRIGK